MCRSAAGFTTVGVVDSGWKSSIPDARIMPGVSFLDHAPRVGQAALNDENGHGTTCTRQILRIASRSWVYPLRVFRSRLETSPRRLLAALRCADALNLDVVNLSLSTHDERARGALYLACRALADRGTIIVASQTNGIGGGYPAAFDSVISVGVSPAPTGPEPDIVITSTIPEGEPTRASRAMSTSLAAAMISGCAARITQQRGRIGVEAMRQLLVQDY